MEIDLESLPEVNKKSTITVVTQPGLRYAQANAIVENLLLDARFAELSARERQYILERLLSEIRGRMMEEIVLLETKMAKPDKKVFKLQFAVGEFDMVVFDRKMLACEIYEIKYSKERAPGQYVIYRGESANAERIRYLNVEEYLKSI